MKGGDFTAPVSRAYTYEMDAKAQWQPDYLERAPLFAPLAAAGARLGTTAWPAMTQLQAELDARGVLSGGGQRLKVVAPHAVRSRAFEARYEARIFHKGELVVRPENWHDLFNVLVWLAFPRAKAAINARHVRALAAQLARGETNRGPAQDALTLFDEGGVIVASSDAGLLQALRDFEWKRLFWRERTRVIEHMRWLLFGHAIYEKALAPFVGITGRGVLFEVAPAFHRLTPAQQTAELDTRLALWVADENAFATPRELAPVPILGVPGWWPANSAEAFYDNADYFRAGRSRKVSVSRDAAL